MNCYGKERIVDYVIKMHYAHIMFKGQYDRLLYVFRVFPPVVNI